MFSLIYFYTVYHFIKKEVTLKGYFFTTFGILSLVPAGTLSGSLITSLLYSTIKIYLGLEL